MGESELQKLKVGQIVVAMKRIVEEDIEADDEADPGDPGWVHAEPGDVGVVEDVGATLQYPEDHPEQAKEIIGVSVRFRRTDTLTLVLPNEVQLIN